MYKIGISVHIIKYILLVTMLLIVSITDIKEFRIPNIILGSFILIRSGILIYEMSQKTIYKDSIVKTLLLISSIFIIGILLKLIVGNGIGFGDVKLLIVVAYYVDALKGIYIIYNSIIIMGVIDAITLMLRVKTRKDAMPFAPAVLLGTISVLVF